MNTPRQKTLFIPFQNLLFSLFVIFFNKFSLFANDGSYISGPEGGALFPLKSSSIQMVEEEVIYDVTSGEFVTTFIFLNLSDSVQRVTFGFPISAKFDEQEYDYDPSSRDTLYEIARINSQMNFLTWVNGKERKRNLIPIIPDTDYNYAFSFTYTFKPKEKIRVVNTFNQGKGYGFSNDGTEYDAYTYILKTGSLWAGNIKKARILFKFSPGFKMTFSNRSDIKIDFKDNKRVISLVNYEEGLKPFPNNNFKVDTTNNTVEWLFSDFKPKFDVSAIFYNSAISNSILFFPVCDSLSFFIQQSNPKNFDSYFNQVKNELKYESEYGKEYFVYVYESVAKFILNGLYVPLERYQIRHIINGFAALFGYRFKNPLWEKMFSQFKWYKPTTENPNYPPEIALQIKQLSELYSTLK
ncbi:MAG: hypothetical protein SFU91_14825 [Chloroherpetonaceae bacterium]|nr:hypothetical protein [Chloroherpetonaceae bacterium]